ncbi:MAG: iron-containing alcohol dehydrogenase, partial [Bacillota bacterium]|nr:iron-containing alcohol dehydrogenase [Bacillota bacterium]
MSNFHVELKKVIDDSYDVEIGFNLMDKMVEDIKNGLVKGVNKFAIVTDSEVEKLYGDKIHKMFLNNGLQADLFAFPAGEKNKTRKTKEFIEDSMLDKSYRRDCCIIAVGGGVVTDLAGFTAGTFGRGVPFINYATTLLAAADASIG